MKRLLIATGLLFIAQAPLAAADSRPPARTSSVAEMLQLKQEHQLRGQLVREGRWDEVRKLDEAQQRRQKMHTKQTLTKMNAEIARILAQPAVKERLLGQGLDPVGGTPEQFATYFKAEVSKWPAS